MKITANDRGAVAEQGPRLSQIRTPDQRLRVFVSSSLQHHAPPSPGGVMQYRTLGRTGIKVSASFWAR
jgi:hypothetical protein